MLLVIFNILSPILFLNNKDKLDIFKEELSFIKLNTIYLTYLVNINKLLKAEATKHYNAKISKLASLSNFLIYIDALLLVDKKLKRVKLSFVVLKNTTSSNTTLKTIYTSKLNLSYS